MNLLLLLSALLSALTGVGANLRPLATAQVMSGRGVAAAEAVASTRIVVGVRPMAEQPSLAIAARAVLPVATPLVAAPRLWIDRRRE